MSKSLGIIPANEKLISVVLISAGILSAFFPVETYLYSLALFGVPHAVMELRSLRHVEKDSHLLWIMLSLAVAGTFLSLFWSLGIFLFVAFILMALNDRSSSQSILFLAGFLLITVCLGMNAILGAMILSFLHNLWVIFFIDSLNEKKRPRWTLLFAGCFFVFALALIIPQDPGTGVAGELAMKQYSSFLPLVSVGAFLQVLHYYFVLVDFPRMTGERKLPWVLVTGVLSSISVFLFAKDVRLAMEIYRPLAATHAWIEYPVLFLFFQKAPAFFRTRMNPSLKS